MSTHADIYTCIVTGQLNSYGPLVDRIESSLCSELLLSEYIATHADINTCIYSHRSIELCGPLVETSLNSVGTVIIVDIKGIHNVKPGSSPSGILSLLGTVMIVSTHI